MDLRALIQSTMETPPDLFNRDGSRYENVRGDYHKICSHLRSEVRVGQAVGIKLPKEPGYLLCILACMELGIAYIPLSEEFPASRIKEIQEDTGLELIIDADYLLSMLKTVKEPSDLALQNPIEDKSPLYIIFTSGSTGRPKGVIISRGAFGAYYLWLSSYLDNVKSDDRVLQVTEFTFDISLVDVILYLTKKTPLYFSGFGGAIFKLAREISDYKISVMSTVPNNVNMLLSDFIVSKSDFSSINTLMIGGARFSYGLYQKVCQHFAEKSISNFYGPTEFTIYSHAKRITFDESIDCIDHNISIGVPNAEVNAEIYDNDRLCEENERGELLLSGKQIMSGYINNPEKTAEVTVHHDGVLFYRTGDLAYKDKNGEVFIVGRLDDTVKYRGYRINLLDIDSYISRLSYVEDVTTIAIPDEIKENITVSFIILKSEAQGSKTPQDIKLDLSKLLVSYQIPEKIEFIEEFPTNISGKVCKKTLLGLYQS